MSHSTSIRLLRHRQNPNSQLRISRLRMFLHLLKVQRRLRRDLLSGAQKTTDDEERDDEDPKWEDQTPKWEDEILSWMRCVRRPKGKRENRYRRRVNVTNKMMRSVLESSLIPILRSLNENSFDENSFDENSNLRKQRYTSSHQSTRYVRASEVMSHTIQRQFKIPPAEYLKINLIVFFFALVPVIIPNAGGMFQARYVSLHKDGLLLDMYKNNHVKAIFVELLWSTILSTLVHLFFRLLTSILNAII